MSLKNTARKTLRGGGKHPLPPPCGLGLKPSIIDKGFEESRNEF